MIMKIVRIDNKIAPSCVTPAPISCSKDKTSVPKPSVLPTEGTF